MEACPICQTKIDKNYDYCRNCAWEFEYYFDELDIKEKKRYKDRLNIQKAIYNKSNRRIVQSDKYLSYQDANSFLKKLEEDKKYLGYNSTIDPKNIKFNSKDLVTSSFGTKGYIYPLSDQKGMVIFFANGEYAGECFSVQWGIGDFYRHTIGKHNSFLGFPISNEYPTKDGARSDFEGGFIEYIKEEEGYECLKTYRVGTRGAYLVEVFHF